MPGLNGERLKKLRVARRWSHGDVAQLLRDEGVKVGPSLIDRWERGGENVAPNILTRLSDIFEVEIQAFRAPMTSKKKKKDSTPRGGSGRR